MTPPANEFGRQSLLNAYLDVQRDQLARRFTPELPETEHEVARREFLTGLEHLFGITLNPPQGSGRQVTIGQERDHLERRVLTQFFRSTADSYLSIRTPWSGYLEAGLLFEVMKEAGIWDTVRETSDSIRTSSDELQEQHRALLDLLLSRLLGDRAANTFTEADLTAIGVTVPVPELEDDWE
ncbi:hypothetical protein [Actinomadura rudentiformis]|uniref:Uncharacterized protein n=1 Tax=Actinomadura rudentiformis TaxID=359158 RepID=A0A6H9YQZ3_9ACTN|nr:hypothetical protein [Actinomadura rudentiformis]KAB2347741.1 hypothetical protein F8566_17675 [Actinomadura rudentiformis]